MRWRCLVGVLVGTGVSAAHGQSNPYCVTGMDWNPSTGWMVKLGMPGGPNDESGSLGYNWGVFGVYNIPAMTNPCYRLNRAWCYDVDADVIRDPVTTGQWVTDNPGKVYLIGNEPDNPDLAAGDGMNPQSYARMYHIYYSFIKPLDPTARVAVAGLAANSTTANVNADIAWWNQVLAYYKSQFGVDMPVDVWNCHCYTPVGELDPDRIISTYFIPFRVFVDTASDGIYADTPIWCTEFGVAMWSIPLAPGYQAEFIQQLCPRLEQAYLLPTGATKRVVDRFFWFLGPWQATWQDSALLNLQKTPTVAGAAYSQLANGYPNAVPSPPADPPTPPVILFVENDFETDASPWRVMAGDWAIDNGAYRQTRMTGPWGLRTHLPYSYGDLHIEGDVKINSANDPNNWVAFNLRGGTVWKDSRMTTYLVLLRQNGELDLYTKADGTVVSVLGAVADMSVSHRLAVTLIGWRFEVELDGQTLITWDDPNHRADAGLVSLEAGMTNCSFDNVRVVEVRPGDFDYDGDVDQSDFGVFQACLSGPGVPQTDSACRRADFNSDHDVDQDDFDSFQGCVTGPNVPADPGCVD